MFLKINYCIFKYTAEDDQNLCFVHVCYYGPPGSVFFWTVIRTLYTSPRGWEAYLPLPSLSFLKDAGLSLACSLLSPLLVVWNFELLYSTDRPEFCPLTSPKNIYKFCAWWMKMLFVVPVVLFWTSVSYWSAHFALTTNVYQGRHCLIDSSVFNQPCKVVDSWTWCVRGRPV
jgi:hypothetical protein